MVIFLIVLGVLIVGGITAFALGLFKIEKVEVDPEEQELLSVPEGADPSPESDPDSADAAGEKVDLTDLAAEEKKPDKPPKKSPSDDNGSQPQYDRLTNFQAGRGYLIDTQKRLLSAKASGEIYAAAYFDFDRFRFINSLKGMSIGDFALTRLSQELAAVFPENSLFTRLSADHFAAVFPVADMEMFTALGERLRELCDRLRDDMGIKSGMRACMGIAITENLDTDYDVQILLHKANVARHCIKASRNESWKIFEDAMIASSLYGESSLDDYSENQYDDEFVIYYSPMQDLTQRHTLGAEAMVRWACEDNPQNPLPEKFRIPTNFTKVLYQSCKAMSRWRKAGKQIIPVYVNIPIIDFYKQDLDEFIARCLSEFQLTPPDLAINVQASIIRTDWSAASRQLKKLHETGVKVGVDEVDIGYTSLDFLSNLSLDYVKLHRSFTADLLEDPKKQDMVRNMASAVKALKLRSIFEGADSQEIAAKLEDLGVQEVQGRVCGRLMQSEDFQQTIPDHVEKHYGKGTVILDDVSLNKGDYNVF